MPQSKSRKIAILGYRSVGEWLPLRCRGLNVGTRPGRVAGGRAGGRRAFRNLHFEWRWRRLPPSPGAADTDRWRGPQASRQPGAAWSGPPHLSRLL